MFTLLITIIAIALVAALALASLYYGGSVFNEGASRAQAAKLEAQSQQIMGAIELFHADTGAYPATLDDLVSSSYLKAIPVAMLDTTESAMSTAQAATTTWTLAGPYAPVIVLAPVSLATCEAFNKAQYGQAGVLKSLRGAPLKQCVGTDLNNLMIVTAKSTADLVAVAADPGAAIRLGSVVPAAIPAATSTDPSLTGWLVAPGTPNSFSYLNSSGAALSTVGFADTKVGETSTATVVTVKNTGTSNLIFTSPGASVGLPFAITANACASATLAPNASCNIAITFTPTEATLYTGASYALSIQTTTLTAGNLPLTGTGTAAVATGLLPAGSQGSVMYRTTTSARRTAAEELVYPSSYPYDSAYYSQYKYVPSPVKLLYYGAVVDGVVPAYDPYRVRVMTSNHYYTVDTPYYDDEHPLMYTNAAALPTYSGPIYSMSNSSGGPMAYVANSTAKFPADGQDIVHVGVNSVFNAHPYFRPTWIFGLPHVSFQYTKEITAVNVAGLVGRSNGLVNTDVCWSANVGDTSTKYPEVCPESFTYAGISEGAHTNYQPRI